MFDLLSMTNRLRYVAVEGEAPRLISLLSCCLFISFLDSEVSAYADPYFFFVRDKIGWYHKN